MPHVPVPFQCEEESQIKNRNVCFVFWTKRAQQHISVNQQQAQPEYNKRASKPAVPRSRLTVPWQGERNSACRAVAVHAHVASVVPVLLFEATLSLPSHSPTHQTIGRASLWSCCRPAISRGRPPLDPGLGGFCTQTREDAALRNGGWGWEGIVWATGTAVWETECLCLDALYAME